MRNFASGVDYIRLYPHGYINIEEGQVYDLSQEKSAWLGGKPYQTPSCGWSQGKEVSGKIIKITFLYRGDCSNFAEIEFEEVDIKNELEEEED